MRPATKLQPELYTVEEYLTFERESEERNEYIDGEIRAMAGESPTHGAVGFNLIASLGQQLRGKPCRGFTPNMKVRSGHPIKQARTPKGLFSYPDLMIVCGEMKFHDQFGDVLLNPTVIFEILSPSTESFDRGEKFWRYRAHLDSLTDYVLISQTLPLVEHFRRQPDDQWLLTTVSGLDAALELTSIGCRLSLAELYDSIEFPTSKEKKPKVKPATKAKTKKNGKAKVGKKR